MDQNYADAANVAIFAGHSYYPYDDGGVGLPTPHQTLAFAHRTNLQGANICSAMTVNVGDPNNWSMGGLGYYWGQHATHAFLLASCALERQIASEMTSFERNSQSFGFESSPFLNDPKPLTDFYVASAAVGNELAWHQTMALVHGYAGNGSAGDVVMTIRDNTDPIPITRYRAEQSLGARVWMGRFSVAAVSNDQEDTISVRPVKCTHDIMCGDPAPGGDWCPDGWYGLGAPVKPFGSLPLDAPLSTAELAPIGTPVFRLGLHPMAISSSAIASGAAQIASGVLQENVAASDLSGKLGPLVAGTQFGLFRPFGDLAVGFEPATQELLLDFLGPEYHGQYGNGLPQPTTTTAAAVASLIESYMAYLPTAGLPAKEYYSIARPVVITSGTLFARHQSDPSTHHSSPPAFQGVQLDNIEYTVYREVNGTPLLNSRLEMWVNRDGKPSMLALDGMQPDTTGPAGAEVAGATSVQTYRSLTKSMLDARFNADALAKFGPNATVLLKNSGFFYRDAPASVHSTYAEPVEQYEFGVRTPEGEQTRTIIWAYRVDDANAPRYEY